MRPRHLAAVILLAALAACQSPEQRVASHLADAQSFFDAGDNSLATIELKNALQINPNLPEAYYLQAQILDAKQDWKGMYAMLKKTVALAPEHLAAHSDLTRLYLLSGEMPQATEQLETVMQLAPDAFNTLLLAGTYQLRKGNGEQAAELADRVWAMNSSDLESISLNVFTGLFVDDDERINSAISSGMKEHPDSPTTHQLRIRVAEFRNDQAGVVEAYQDLIAIERENLEYRRALATYHLRQADDGAAEAALRSAVADLPGNTQAKLLLARFLAGRSETDGIEALESFVSESQDSALKFELARLYKAQGQSERAADVYREVLNANHSQEDAVFAQNQLATMALRSDRGKEARSLIDAVLTKEPNQPDALLLKAYTQLEDRDTSAVIASVRVVLRDEPDNDRALTLMGKAYQQRYAMELAESSFAQAVEINPYNVVAVKELAGIYLSRNSFKQAEQMLQPVIGRGLADATMSHMYVQSKLAADNWNGARLAASDIFGEDSEYSRYIEAVALQAQGEHEAAITLLAAMLKEKPETKAVLAAMVRSVESSQRDGGALAYLENYLADAPENLSAIELLVGEYERLGRGADAERLIQRTLKANPRWLAGYSLLAQKQVRAKDFGSARRTYEQALEQQPGVVAIQLRLAGIADRLGDESDAERIYREILVVEPENDIAANNLAMVLSRDEATLPEALTVAKRFADTRQPTFADTLGWIYFLNGEVAKGRALLEMAYKAAPQSAEIRAHLGLALAEEQRFQEAAPLLSQSIEFYELNDVEPSFDLAEAREILNAASANGATL